MSENVHSNPADSAHGLRETTPDRITPMLESYAAHLTDERPVRVPVRPATGAQSGWCHRNVSRVVATQGGRAVFGWTIWSCSLFATFEFHAVHMTDAGDLVDVTPKDDGETEIVFAPDFNLRPDYDFMQRPHNELFRLYDGRPVKGRAADLIRCLSPGQERFERKRAAKAGMTLEAWVASRMKLDPLATAIDRFIDATKAADALLRPTPFGQSCEDIPLYRTLEARRHAAFSRMFGEWQSHSSRLLGASAGGAVADAGTPGAAARRRGRPR